MLQVVRNIIVFTCKFLTGYYCEAPEETWSAINNALFQGLRGLPGGNSLAKLLEEERGIRNHGNLPELTIDQILAWIDSHFERTGKWPNRNSGPVHGLHSGWTRKVPITGLVKPTDRFTSRRVACYPSIYSIQVSLCKKYPYISQ